MESIVVVSVYFGLIRQAVPDQNTNSVWGFYEKNYLLIIKLINY
jgi:hypothetical protein